MTSVSKKVEPRRLKGFRDYMPDLMETRSHFQSLIRSQAKLAGFREIGTPALEYAEILLGQGSEETDKQVYRFDDHGGRPVALRFDLTVPFARFIAENHGTLVFPFKRFQIGDVWRGENTQKGRYREFCQCDLDIIGVDSLNADAEILSCFYQILTGFDLGGFTMRIGNRLILSELLRTIFSEIDDQGETQALIALDKLDKIGVDAVVELLAKLPFADLSKAKGLLNLLIQKDGDGNSDLNAIELFLASNDRPIEEILRLKRLKRVLSSIQQNKVGGRFVVDLSIARGLGYYTGVVFETTLDRLPGFGSISSGGRYNNLAERFTNRSLPGVGGSIGLDRLLAALEEMGKISGVRDPVVFIALATEDSLESGMILAQQLRSSEIACDIGLTSGKVGNQFKHADRLGCPVVITLGTSEVAANTFNLKNMKSGAEQKGLPRGDVLHILKQELQL